MTNLLDNYINKIIKNKQNPTYINGKEWFCEYYNNETKEFIFRKVDGDFIFDFTEDKIKIEDFDVSITMNEYNIKYEEAAEKKEYLSTKSVDILKIKDNLLKCIKEGHMQSLNGDNVLYMIEFGCIDVELTLYDVVDNKLDIGFFVCVKINEDNWESHGFCDEVFDIDILNLDKLEFEQLLFGYMINYAEKHKLYWSKYN